jgi:hypothetical protein
MSQTQLRSSGGNPRFTIKQSLVFLIFVPFLIQACRYLYVLVRCVTARTDVAYPEFANVYIFLHSASIGKIYADPFQLPLDPQIYGPVFYIFGAFIAKFAHGDPQKTAEIARFIAFVSLFVVAALVAAVCQRLEHVKRWTLAAVVLTFACTWSMPLFASVRADAAAVCVGFAAFAIYIPGKENRKHLFLAGVIASLAILTKQTLLCVPIALLLDMALSRRFRNAAIFILGMIPLPVVVFGSLILHGEHFYTSLVLNGRGQLLLGTCISTVGFLIRGNENSLVVFAVAVIGAVAVRNDQRYRPVLLTCVISWVMGGVALANVGAASNYLMFPWLSLLPFIPRGIGKLEAWTLKSPVPAIVLIAASAFLLYHQTNLWLGSAPGDLNPAAVVGHKMLSDVPYLETYSKEPQMLDPFFYSNLYGAHQWDPSIIEGQVENEKYDLLLFEASKVKPGKYVTNIYRNVPYMASGLIDQVNGHYLIRCVTTKHAILVPKDRPDTIDWATVDQIFGEPCVKTSGVLTTDAVDN